MITYLKANYLTIIVLAILVLCVALIIRKMIKDKRNGKCSCGCDCSTCSAGCPHSQNQN